MKRRIVRRREKRAQKRAAANSWHFRLHSGTNRLARKRYRRTGEGALYRWTDEEATLN